MCIQDESPSRRRTKGRGRGDLGSFIYFFLKILSDHLWLEQLYCSCSLRQQLSARKGEKGRKKRRWRRWGWNQLAFPSRSLAALGWAQIIKGMLVGWERSGWGREGTERASWTGNEAIRLRRTFKKGDKRQYWNEEVGENLAKNDVTDVLPHVDN